MKKLFKEFFYVPKYGKVREKVMLMHVAMSVVIIVMCLAAMSLSAYAYFSHNVTFGSNIIKAATFEADVLISITENDSSTAVDVTKNSNASYTADLKAGKTYTVILDESQNSTAKTGFVVVTADKCPDIYHTQQLGVDTTAVGDFTDQIVFHLRVSADTNVYFVSHWGTSSHYAAYAERGEGDKLYITNANINENSVVLTINSAMNSVSEEKTERTETEPPVTELPTPETSESETAKVVYTIKFGDTLSEIAVRYDTTVALLAAYNNIANPGEIQAGQQLKIPPANWQPVDATEPSSAS